MIAFWSAIVSLLILNLIGWLFAWYNRKQLKLLAARMQEMERSLRSELTMVNNGAIGVGQRVIAAEKRINELLTQQENTSSHAVEDFPFTQAAALVEQGVDAAQLVERCGLSEAEAQLLAMMKQKPSSDKNSLN